MKTFRSKYRIVVEGYVTVVADNNLEATKKAKAAAESLPVPGAVFQETHVGYAEEVSPAPEVIRERCECGRLVEDCSTYDDSEEHGDR